MSRRAPTFMLEHSSARWAHSSSPAQAKFLACQMRARWGHRLKYWQHWAAKNANCWQYACEEPALSCHATSFVAAEADSGVHMPYKRLFTSGLWKKRWAWANQHLSKMKESTYEKAVSCFTAILSSQGLKWYMVMANFVSGKCMVCSALLPLSLIVFYKKGKTRLK